MAWTNDHSLEFIDLYRRERILWDPKHPQNKNRTEISEAWLRIQSCMSINCSVIDLKKKKESLMTSFRFHWHRKKKNPQYRTTWFAYTVMEAFLCDKYECDSTNELENELFSATEVYSHSSTNVDPISCQNTRSTEKSNINIKQQTSKQFTIKRNSRNQPVESRLQSFKNVNEDSQKLDEYDLYCQLLATKLKKLDEHQRDVAMHDIDNIMFRAKMHGNSTHISSTPVSRKLKSPIFIVTSQNHTQYEDENISYPEHIQTQEPS